MDIAKEKQTGFGRKIRKVDGGEKGR